MSEFPEVTVELAQIATRLVNEPTVADVTRAYEIIFGERPDPARSALEVAQEVAVALKIMLPTQEAKAMRKTKTVVEATAANGKGMTLRELRDFVDSFGSVSAGDITPTVRISFGGGIKSIKATVETV